MAVNRVKKGSAEERRTTRRMIVQESFHLFLVIPDLLGMVRIYMRDLSKGGLCFRSEVETNLKMGQKLKAQLYLNPAFYLPIEIKVLRMGAGEVGVEFVELNDPAVQAIGRLQDFFDAAEKAGVLVV